VGAMVLADGWFTVRLMVMTESHPAAFWMVAVCVPELV